MAPTDVMQLLRVSPRSQTPPSGPELPAHGQMLSSRHVQLFVNLLKSNPDRTGCRRSQPAGREHRTDIRSEGERPA